ncbi:MAG: carboxypeptidase-like regulatory domain-containing protein [Acidobacteriota bacterium]|nr:carboxypeptidase-like regulatory domain-containing protein [Acidobacteriota bacterium]
MRRFRTSLVVRLAIIMAFSLNVNAQSQRDESSASPSTGTITGHVTTENGEPLPNATVYLRGSTPLFQPRMVAADGNGNFQFSALDPLLYGILAMAPGYVAPMRDPDNPAAYYRVGDSVSISLVKGGVVTGTVLSSSGDPVVEVSVRAMLIRDAGGQQPKYTAYGSSMVTDDRGVYRIYGLLPGTYVISAGGRGSFTVNVFGGDAPTYAPSSTRDTASEIAVRAGEETSGIDIRYRGEPGHIVSGSVTGLTDPNSPHQTNINLMQISNGLPQASAYTVQAPNSKGFTFYGVADGEYDLTAQYFIVPGEYTTSEPRRVTVKDADITGIELTLKPLASISGHVTLETSDALECKNKRQPLFSETLVMARRNEKSTPKDQGRPLSFSLAQGSPNKSGDFVLRNLAPGQYSLNARFFAKYWYLRSINRDTSSAPPGGQKVGPASRPTEAAARNAINLNFGELIKGMTLTLAEGAASLRGMIKLAAGENLPPMVYLHLVPAEKENAEDVLRFFVAEINYDGTFAFNNLPPGRYWALAQVSPANESHSDSKLRAPDEAQTRAQLRRAAEATKTEIDLKPCQNVTDYRLQLARASLKD